MISCFIDSLEISDFIHNTMQTVIVIDTCIKLNNDIFLKTVTYFQNVSSYENDVYHFVKYQSILYLKLNFLYEEYITFKFPDRVKATRSFFLFKLINVSSHFESIYIVPYCYVNAYDFCEEIF